MFNKKKIASVCLTGVVALTSMVATGCTEADVASRNLSKSAGSFDVYRKIVFFNGITDNYLLTIEGYCSLSNYGNYKELSVTCKVGDKQYKKHFLGLSDNVSYFVEQLEPKQEEPFHYKVIFRPETIVPDIELQTSLTN